MSNNSDYKKVRTKLHELLPEPNQSDVNKVVFENLFNRFLTKQETERTAGYIGEGNPNAVVSRQLKEPTIHRQAFQLQPVLYNKIGTIEHMSSWNDLLNEIQRQGIDLDRFDEWGKSLVFNWVPPVDIDKLIHYRDYYWYDEQRPNSSPQYITVRSRCNTAQAKVNFWQALIDEFGETIPIAGVSEVDEVFPSFTVTSINDSTDTVVVTGDASEYFVVNDFFDITGTADNNGTYQIISPVVYDEMNDETTIVVIPGSFTSSESSIGSVRITRYDKIIILNDVTRLLEPGFVFFLRDSTNTNLNNSFLSVTESEYDSDNNQTVVTLNIEFTDKTADGVVSLTEEFNTLVADRDCLCGDNSAGWDLLQWDDNPEDPLWGGSPPGTYADLITAISNPTSPFEPPNNGAGVENQLWFDTTNDVLYQYGTLTDWKVMYNNFSLILDETEGLALWDASLGCDTKIQINGIDQWTEQNRWLHKSDVPNFSIAKQAQIPIIEYDWDLELNEWVHTEYIWKYRRDKFEAFEDTTEVPSLIELVPLSLWEYDSSTNEIVLDERYGDLTDWFVAETLFQSTTTTSIYEVEWSRYYAESSTEPFKTRITIVSVFGSTDLVSGDLTTGTPSSTPLRPHRTSLNDPWKEYHDHWLFVESKTPTAINHQPENPFVIPDESAVSTLHGSGDYQYLLTQYSQTFEALTSGLTTLILETSVPTGSTRGLHRRAVVGNNDVRVYVNDIRQHGTYDELSETVMVTDSITGVTESVEYVRGIEMLPGYELDEFDVVRVEVGEATIREFGYYAVPVRMIEGNMEFEINGPTTISLINNRKSEQVKTQTNQYPLFDIYRTDGSSAKKANSIFTYRTSSEADVNPLVGQRIVVEDDKNYLFEQQLLDGQSMLAYRDYSNQQEDIWFNPKTQQLLFWDGFTWSDKIVMDNHYRSAIVGNQEPESPVKDIDGLYWYDTLLDELKIRDSSINSWTVVTTLDEVDYDLTLQTIWKKGLNDEQYVPKKRDWMGRTYEEYEEERMLFVNDRVAEIVSNSSTTISVATTQANQEWLETQQNEHSETGEWIGEWEIPDQLYHNHLHENRRILRFNELLTHFSTIIDQQPKIPGFIGRPETMFHLIPTDEVNYGLGGKIKEFNNAFDTFLSSVFVNELTFRTLVDFANDQYESLLNNLKELLRNNLYDLMINTSTDSLIDFNSFVSETTIEEHQQNDFNALVYSDSTTFNSEQNIGIRNWIATLPYLNLVHKRLPVVVADQELNVHEIIHHDGHRTNYSFEDALKEGIIQLVLNTDDPRTRFPSPSSPPQDTYGKQSIELPPNNITEFATEFNTTITDREGVYWYQVDGTKRQLYRLEVANVGVNEPSSSLPDGTLWFDTEIGLEVLRIKETIGSSVQWSVVSGLTPGDGRLHNGTTPSDISTATVSAWKEVNLDDVLVSVLYDVETKLYQNVPDNLSGMLAFDFTTVTQTLGNNVLFNQILQQLFLEYVRESEIIGPFKNDEYDLSDPFTWNYKFSTVGVGYPIVDADSATNTFTIEGDQVVVFDPCTSSGSCPSTVSFFIKNSDVNDGTWETITSVLGTPAAEYNSLENTTTVYVTDAVTDSIEGIIYKGELPSSDNTGAESGGDWRDLYQKLYNTPYPHLEPWKLQGYIDKPSWWDEEYLNDDPNSWGIRRWKYKHGFEIVNVSTSSDTFTINGDFTSVFTTGFNFDVDQSAGTHNGTYSVSSSTYNSTNNTTDVAVNENIVNSVIEGRIKVAFGMWENIKQGVIPSGREYSNGVVSITGDPSTDSASLTVPTIPQYNYFSVNIDNSDVSSDGGTTTYESDSLFPPYWNYVGHFGSSVDLFDRTIRSVFSSFSTEIVAPSADYTFGDAGPVEWEWRNSSRYLYDRLIAAYRIQPVDLFSSIFGFDIQRINELEIDSRTEQVPSHTRTVFHGDVVNDMLTTINGTNQWYVNFTRFTGLDGGTADFRSNWVEWTAPMTYQFASFIDTDSFQLAHRTLPISLFDYNVTSKRSPGAEDYWVEAFNVTILDIPPSIVRYDNEGLWRLELDSSSPLNRTINYYDVRNYQFYVDPTTDVCTLYTYIIESANVSNNTFAVMGDQTQVFSPTREFTVTGSTSNDGIYTVLSSVYDAVSNTTLVEVDDANIPDSQADGIIQVNYRTLPWETGEKIWFSSDETLPSPLIGDTSIGTTIYYIIKLNDTQFKIARTQSDAIIGNAIDITTSGRRNHYVGEILSTFVAMSGEHADTAWKHYAIDTTNVLSFTPPHDIQGMQTLVNIIDGYAQYISDQGWGVNVTSEVKDPTTNRIVNWQLETERFIDFAYSLRRSRHNVTDKFQVTVNESTNTWTFVDSGSQFITGEPINVISSNNVYPEPLVARLKYYIIRDSVNEFRLAATKNDAEQGKAINITSVVGVDDLFVAKAKTLRKNRPNQQINPFRNNIWFSPERGIVSNVVSGPTEDIRNTQLMFDQYGRELPSAYIQLFREDKLTEITVTTGVENDVELTSIFQDPYNYIHLGGMHLFVDTYEHALVFNNYTSEGALLYDPFIGLNVTKFELLFNKQIDFTQRPNVGGYYLSTDHNQGADLRRNIEASVEDIRLMHDTYNVFEASPLTANARRMLGYTGTRSYLDNINLNQKSQFLFWKGMIQYKGAVNAMQAFINSRRFIDAKLDEFWAVKIADFGAIGEKEYPQLYLTTVDTRSDDLKLEFVDQENDPASNEDFIPISLADENRWFEQPNQVRILRDNGSSFYFDMKAADMVRVTISDIEPSDLQDNEGWIDTDASVNGFLPSYVTVDNAFYRWDKRTGSWIYHGGWNDGQQPLIRHNFSSDSVSVTLDLYENENDIHQTLTGLTGTSLTVNSYIPETASLKIFKNGTQLTKDQDYTEDSSGGLFSTGVTLVDALVVDDLIEVVHTTARLIEGTHFTHINSDIIQFEFEQLITTSTINNFKVWGLIVDKESQNPAKLIDKQAESVVSSIQIWDPARGFHYQTALVDIDITSNIDPAVYTHTEETNQEPSSSLQFPYRNYNNSWNSREVGTVWFDTSVLGYVPYYDTQIYPNINVRLRLWGQLAEWAEPKIYEWVQSDVPPDEWNAVAEQEEGDASIPEHQRKSGRVRQTLFEEVSPDVWEPLTNKIEKFDVHIEGVEQSPSVYRFTLSQSVAGDEVDVYVNGRIQNSGVVVQPGNYIDVSGLSESAHIHVLQPIPTDQSVIDTEIEAGNLKQTIEHTQETYYDEFGIERTRYYFWVEQKNTRSENQNISPREIEQQLVTIPIPHMFFQNPIPAETVNSATNVDINRNWTHIVTQQTLDKFAAFGGRQIIQLGTPVKDNDSSNINVSVNEVTATFVLSSDGRELEISSPSLILDDRIDVNYVASIPTEVYDLPSRLTQLIVRGLRGFVNDDRRYVLRFTRDFTLRDDLDAGNTELELKNSHQEWLMFREQQTFHISRDLWDKITESIVGYKLNDPNTRVPSLDRELYDQQFNTDVRFGLREGQAFTNGTTALETILADLNNPDNDFYPTDINVFFDTYSFGTPENIIEAMNAIYNTFAFEHVNRMFFAVLHDAMSVKTKYPDILKTSMIALHGIRPFQTGGLFDD